MMTAINLSTAIDGYLLTARARQLSRHTIRDYSNTFAKFTAFLDGDPALAAITKVDIQRFLAAQEGVSKKTVLNYHVGLSALWSWALSEQFVTTHIVRAVKAPKAPLKEIIPYSEDDIRKMIGSLERSKVYKRPGKRANDHRLPNAKRNKAIIFTLLDTGIRAEELRSLQRSHVDLDNNRIRVVNGKGDKGRLLPISPNTAKVYWRYDVSRYDHDGNPDAPAFANGNGMTFKRGGVLRLIKRVAKRADLTTPANVHRFRHTFAINFLRKSPNPWALQQMLGHSDIKMVNRYLAIVEGDIQAVHKIASPVANWGLR